jgi:hypothetical protein
MTISIYQSTGRHVSEDFNLHHSAQNLVSQKTVFPSHFQCYVTTQKKVGLLFNKEHNLRKIPTPPKLRVTKSCACYCWCCNQSPRLCASVRLGTCENLRLWFHSYFFFFWAPVASAPGSTAAMKTRLIVRARLWKFPLVPPGAPTPTTRETSSRERGSCGREMSG